MMRVAVLLTPLVAVSATEAGDAGGGVVAQAIGATWTFAKETASDLAGLVTAPLRFDASDWAIAGGVVGGGILLGTIGDANARQNVQEDRTTSSNEVAT